MDSNLVGSYDLVAFAQAAAPATDAPTPTSPPTQAPTPEDLEKVRPWIQDIIRNWDGGDQEDYVNEVLELVFGAKAAAEPPKPSDEDLKRVQPWIVDKVIRWARESGMCGYYEVNEALAEVFPTPSDGWRDSDGFTCDGYGPDGFNADGFNEEGYDRDGFSEVGLDNDGYDRDGFHHRIKMNRQGLTREEWHKTPAGAAAYVKALGPEFITALRDALSTPAETSSTE